MSTLIADPDTMRIMPLYVASHHLQRTAVMQGTIRPDIQVIARPGTKSACLVASPQLLQGEGLIGPRVSAMQHNQVDASWVCEAVGSECCELLSVIG